jgi:hypothetical protein
LPSTVLVLDKKSQKRHVQTQEKLDKIGIRLEASPKKSLYLSVLQFGSAKITVHIGKKTNKVMALQNYSLTEPFASES